MRKLCIKLKYFSPISYSIFYSRACSLVDDEKNKNKTQKVTGKNIFAEKNLYVVSNPNSWTNFTHIELNCILNLDRFIYLYKYIYIYIPACTHTSLYREHKYVRICSLYSTHTPTRSKTVPPVKRTCNVSQP